MSLSRPTANKVSRKFGCAVGASLMLLSLSVTSAVAKPAQPQPSQPAGACTTQAFSQPFTALGDSNNYSLVPGGEFNSPSEGWSLFNGAHITQTTRPDGSTGGALDMPSGSVAVSPPVCVNLLYPTARVWERSPGGGSVTVEVVYAATKSATQPKTVGSLEGEGSGWTLSEPFEVRPELGGPEEGNREVRFVFIAGHNDQDSQLYGLWVDPRMR